LDISKTAPASFHTVSFEVRNLSFESMRHSDLSGSWLPLTEGEATPRSPW
jgi:hypothetical protein